MSRRCELTGKAVQSGNKVSHSNRKTRTRFLPNLVQVTLVSDVLERSVRLRVTAAALRSVEHRGGLDDFLVKAHESELSDDAVKLKRAIIKKRAERRPRAKPQPPRRRTLRLDGIVIARSAATKQSRERRAPTFSWIGRLDSR